MTPSDQPETEAPVPTGGEPTPTEDPTPPVTTTETPKKKPLSEERLKQLAKAREKAAATHARKREEKLRAKVAALPPEAPLDAIEPKPVKTEPPPAPEPIVVVEQSESDEDEYTSPPGVIFVKRKRKKPPPAPEQPRYTPQEEALYQSFFPSAAMGSL